MKFQDEPRPIWRWFVFGKGTMMAHLPHDVPWTARFITRVLLGSRWERIE